MTTKKHIILFLLLFVISSNATAQIDIACIGNSITWGDVLLDRANQCYPSQLGVLLGDNYLVRNYGSGGRTLLQDTELPYIESGQHTFSIAIPHDVVIILLGTNDSDEDNWDAKANFKIDYYDLIDDYKNYPGHDDPVFILGLPPPVFDESQGHRNDPIINEIIPLIKQVANELNLTIADFYSALDGKPELFLDGVHPNPEGAQIMAGVAFNAIQEALTTSDPAPSTPTGLITIPEQFSISLEWHANLEDDIFQYRIFRSDSEYGFQNIIGNVLHPDTTFTDNNVIIDHIYYYAIDALDNQGNISARSSKVSGKTYDNIPPVHPANLTVSLIADSIKLEWSPNSENDLSRYYVYRSSDQITLQNADNIVGTVYPPSSYFNDINYVSSETYFYGVKAMDVSGNQSTISNIVTTTARSRPVSNDTTIIAFEDTIRTFNKLDFTFNDDDGDNLEKIYFIEANNWDLFQYDNQDISYPIICEDISKLTFTSLPNEFGDSYAAFKYKVIDSFGSSSIDTNIVIIDVAPVNDEPTLDPIEDVYVMEDSHGIILPLAGITSGQIDEIQNLSIQVIPRDTSLIKIGDIYYTSPEANGQVILDPVENVFGSRTITIRVWDDGGTENGGINYTDETFYLYITPINDPPIFNFVEKINLTEDTDTVIKLNGVQPGPWEFNQNITMLVKSNNIDLLPTPLVEYSNPDTSANLSFNLLPNIYGNTSITLTMIDDGGTEFGGKDSTSYIIPVEIISVNDKPSDFEILIPNIDSTIVINKQNLTDSFNISWEPSEDIENDNIQYNIIFNNDLSELSKFGLKATSIEIPLTELLSATDTVSITKDSFSIFASDGTDETPALNNSISITVNGQMFAPAKLNLDQNYPNPFNNTTLIGFDLPKKSEVSLIIYNLLGKEVIRLIDSETYPRGYSTINWNGLDKNNNHIPAGIYFMQVNTDNAIQRKKLLLLK